LEFDDERMTLKNAEPHPKDEIGNKLYWDVNDFYAGNDGSINLSFAVASQSEEDIEMVATISQATGEGNFDDNTSRLLQALDDEDFEFKKEVLPNYGSDTAYLTDTSERVEYQITFSNYTDDTIRTVYVLDTIKLNHSMLHIKEIARSHNATVEALEGIPGEDIGVLLWTFHDINLPPNPTHNPEIVNHIGFVSFEIGLESDLTPGVMLTNTAHVTFDYFPTEPTNPVFAMIQQPAAIINTFKFSPLDIYPNPATNQISILENDAYANKEFRIISVQGNEMNSGLVNGSNSIDISSLSSGIYMVEIIKDKTVYRSKFIKI
jgi:hypothetical protein